MKWIYILLCSICITSIANAQQNKQQKPPERTTDPAKTQTVSANLPVKKSDNGKAATNTSTSMPMRKTDITGSGDSKTGNNKTAAENSKQQTPSSAGVPKKVEAASSGKP